MTESDDAPDPGPTEEPYQPEQTDGEEQTAPPRRPSVDRSVVMTQWLRMAATTALRLILISIVVVAGLILIGRVWVGVLPIVLALIISTVLWPPVAMMRRYLHFPAALAAGVGLLVPFAVVGGVFAAIAPSVSKQAADLISQGSHGLRELQEWAQGPPINLQNEQVDAATQKAIDWMQQSSSQIASGVFTGVSAASSALIAIVLILVLTFFFLKDGPRFLPWARQVVGRSAGRHLTEAATRVWRTLSGFIRTQAIVSAVDAILIGVGLIVLQVPLAAVLALLTFFGGFIPIVGAFAVGALAVLVALVANGWATALGVLILILIVQQLEGNVLQPFLQGKSMQLHAGIILISVAVGGTLFGIIGAFLAVPVAAVFATTVRYISEQIDLRTGEVRPEEVTTLTPEGAEANRMAVRMVDYYRERSDQSE